MSPRDTTTHAAPHTTVFGFPFIIDEHAHPDVIQAVSPASAPRAERTTDGGRIVRTYRVLAEIRL